MKKISVIIPTRNRFEYVSLLLEDLQNQDIDNFEVIIVDQSDEKKKLENCKHIFLDATGPCISRNVGVQNSSGEVLVFLDDDARIYSNFLREITEPILNNRFDAVSGAVCDPDGNYLLKEKRFLTKNSFNFIKILTNNPDSKKSRICTSFPGCCSGIKRDVFENIGGFNEEFDPTGAGEDREMAIKLYVNGYATWYNAKAKLLHKAAPEGGSRDVGSRSIMLDVHTYKICKQHFSKELAETLKKNIISRYKQNLISSIFTGRLVRTNYKNLKKVKQFLK